MTRFARCSRWQALGILLMVLAGIGGCIAVAATHEIIPRTSEAAPTSSSPSTGGDAAFYRAVIQRMQSGENYYAAVAVELRQEGYQPHSVFNWRPPLYAWIFSALPSPGLAQVLLLLLAGGVGLLTYQALHAEGKPRQAALAAVLLPGALAWCCFPDVALFAELWSGLCIALSVLAMALDRGKLGWAAALAAVGFREFALPFYLLATCRAWSRRRDFPLWLGGLAVCGLYLALHVRAASGYLHNQNVVHAGGWVQFGGLVFVLLTAQMNVLLLTLPSEVTAVYLPLALLGLVGWRGRAAALAAITVFGFVGPFLLIGMWPHNGYWGLMYAPLLTIGLALAPAAVRELCGALLRSHR